MIRGATLAVAVVLVFACSSSSPEVSLRTIASIADGQLEFSTTCAENVAIQIQESDTEVRVVGVSGDSIDGDCSGSGVAPLRAPLGDRTVVVDDAVWVSLAPGCPLGVIGPESIKNENVQC